MEKKKKEEKVQKWSWRKSGEKEANIGIEEGDIT